MSNTATSCCCCTAKRKRTPPPAPSKKPASSSPRTRWKRWTRHMRNRSSNKTLLGASLYACACLSIAQTPAGKPASAAAAPIAAPPIVAVPPPLSAGADALADALTCRISYERYPGLMQEIRDEREDDFRQAYRQHSQPMLDVYRLEEPISAWGNESDVIVIAPNRVMMAITGS